MHSSSHHQPLPNPQRHPSDCRPRQNPREEEHEGENEDEAEDEVPDFVYRDINQSAGSREERE